VLALIVICCSHLANQITGLKCCMFNIFKKKKPNQPQSTSIVDNAASDIAVESELTTAASTSVEHEHESVTTAKESPQEMTLELAPKPSAEPQPKPSFFGSLAAKLARTKASIGSGIADLFVGRSIDDELYEDLETQLLVADVGMHTTQNIIEHLTQTTQRSTLKDGDALLAALKEYMTCCIERIYGAVIDEN